MSSRVEGCEVGADAAGEAAQRELGGLERLLQAIGVRAQVQTESGHRFQRAAAAELTAQLLRRGDQEVVELLQRGGARFSAPALATLSCRIASTIPFVCLGAAVAVPLSAGAGGELGVDRVALAQPLAGMRMRLGDPVDPAQMIRDIADHLALPETERPFRNLTPHGSDEGHTPP